MPVKYPYGVHTEHMNFGNQKFTIDISKEVTAISLDTIPYIIDEQLRFIVEKAKAGSPINIYVLNKLQQSNYSLPEFRDHVNALLLFISKKARPHCGDELVLIKQALPQVIESFSGYVWYLHGREAVLPMEHYRVAETMFKDHAERMELLIQGIFPAARGQEQKAEYALPLSDRQPTFILGKDPNPPLINTQPKEIKMKLTPENFHMIYQSGVNVTQADIDEYFRTYGNTPIKNGTPYVPTNQPQTAFNPQLQQQYVQSPGVPNQNTTVLYDRFGNAVNVPVSALNAVTHNPPVQPVGTVQQQPIYNQYNQIVGYQPVPQAQPVVQQQPTVRQVVRTVMKSVQQPVTDGYGRVIGYNTVMQPTQEIGYETINPAISSAVPNQPHVSGLFTHAQPQAVSAGYTANNNGDDNFVTRINGKPATGTREFYVKQALERLNNRAANLGNNPPVSQASNFSNPNYQPHSAVVEPTGNAKLYSTPEETVSFNLHDNNNPLDNYVPSGSRANKLYADILPTNRANGAVSRTPDGVDVNALNTANTTQPVDPNNTDWEEVPNNTPWVHSIYQPRPNVYNERAFDRKLFKRIKDGKVQMKEEFEKKMEYEYHYLADSRSDQVANAEYDKAKINIANRTNREVEEISNKEAENEVIYLLPTPDSAEWTDIYKHDKVEYSLSNGSMFWYHSLIKAKVIADCVANKKETPDAYISNCFKCIPSIESSEVHHKFIEDLCQADSWLAVKAVITKHATHQTRNFRRKLEFYLTREINLILSAAIGIGWSIGSFYDDIEDLHKELGDEFGEIYLKALERSYKKGSIFINHLSDSDVESFRSRAADVLVPYEDLADIKDFTCVARKSLVLSVCESSGDLELNVGYNDSKQINPKEARRLYKLLDNLLNEVGGEHEIYLTTEDGIVYRIFRNELDSTLIMAYNDTRPLAD